MAQLTFERDVPPIVERKLAQVRRGIRTYVWLEGLAGVVTTLVLAFWAGMLADWLFEPSPRIRLGAMIVVGALALWVAYRYLLRRAFVHLTDASLAVLLERRFRELKDHLLTTVDLATGDDEMTVYHPEFMTRTHQAAVTATSKVDARELFRRGPLVRRVLVALALAASIPIFALTTSSVFGFWIQRLALSNELWPRRVHLEVVGFPADASGQRVHKVARDDKFELVVHADARDYRPAETSRIPLHVGRRRTRTRHDDPCRRSRARARRVSRIPLRIQRRLVEHDARRDRWRRSRERPSPGNRRPAGAGRHGNRVRLPRVSEPLATAIADHRWHANSRGHRALVACQEYQAAHRRPRPERRQSAAALALRRGPRGEGDSLGLRQASSRRRAHHSSDRHGWRHQPRAVSDFAGDDSRRAAASLRAARGHRLGDHAGRDRAVCGQGDRRLRAGAHLVCLPGKRRVRRTNARSPISPMAGRNKPRSARSTPAEPTLRTASGRWSSSRARRSSSRFAPPTVTT